MPREVYARALEYSPTYWEQRETDAPIGSQIVQLLQRQSRVQVGQRCSRENLHQALHPSQDRVAAPHASWRLRGIYSVRKRTIPVRWYPTRPRLDR